ncbi:MAG: hypothetical protein ACYC5G_01575 [Candidatus Doudnabacteria bacterium]
MKLPGMPRRLPPRRWGNILFRGESTMPTTKIMAHQYVCIRALEAILSQLTLGFAPASWYRVLHTNLRNQTNNKHVSIRGKLLKLSTVSDGNGKLEVGFYCTIELRTLLGLWDPSQFKLLLEGETYEGSFASSATYNIIVSSMHKLPR